MTITDSPNIYRPAPTSSPDTRRRRSQGQSHRRPLQRYQTSTFASTLRASTHDMKSMASRTSTLSSTKQSSGPTDSSGTTKISTSTYKHSLSITDNQYWTLVKGPTSKYHDECWYSYIEMLAERGSKQNNTVYCFEILEKSCSDPFRGRWRTTTSSGAAKLPWHGLH